MRVTGVLLAAGAGSRLGGPKALLRRADGSAYLAFAVDALLGGGCDRVTVVLGAAADLARPLVPSRAEVAVVLARDWPQGMSASLRAGLEGLAAGDAGAALVMLVDLPDVTAAVVRRVLGAAGPRTERALVRATYGGRPGHPVLLGRAHWPGVLAGLSGDEGARAYLAQHGTLEVECGDLAAGYDVDRPGDEPR